ncbi:hypothetical protein NLX67_20150 [Domibacillus sp. A3M-37]|uniref:hypothetical protein n=1 Tax=Domibacillus sp. A3M-37 TaxID=2962037 RepID=UPI0020B83BD6|nr:hypothetical protein [Domibacillus sp. A3M-37]MCP3764656.1 hypothetical protein [Domibacillus sp. A3M-37]
MNPYTVMVVHNAFEQKETITCSLFIIDEEALSVLYTEGFSVKTKKEVDAYVEKVKWRFLRCI